ncbi:MAG: hypothetical protein ACYCQJ_02400 [Nitrososphaerales archaeon]
MISIYYYLIALAIGLAIVAEVLVAYQKYQMKKQFREELDRNDAKEKDSSK